MVFLKVPLITDQFLFSGSDATGKNYPGKIQAT